MNSVYYGCRNDPAEYNRGNIMSMQIKGKFIKSEAIDGSKIKLKAGEALKGVDSNGQEVELVKLVDGEVKLKGEGVVKSSELAAEKARAEGVEAELAASVSALEAEVGNNLQGAIAGLQADVAAETARAEAAEGTLTASVSALQAQVGTDLQNTISSLQAADAANLAEAKAHAEAKVAEIVGSAPEVLNTLKELSDALGGDENFAATISGQIGSIETNLSSETSAREAAITGLDSKVSGIVASSNVLFEDNINVYADSAAGRPDPEGREGWYFVNDTAGKKINWYFFNSTMATVTKGQLGSMYMVATVDTPDNRPYLAYYTARQEDGLNASSWYRSRLVFLPASPIPAQGKYVLFFGTDPGVHPELPRVEMVIDSQTTRGPQGAEEIVMLGSVQSDSSHGVNLCKFLVHKTGLTSSVYNQENSLVIKNDMTIEKLKLNMEAIKWKSEKFVITAEMIAQGFVEIEAKEIIRDSLMAHVDRLAIFKDEDFTVSYGTNGKFRLTFAGSILPGESEQLEAGDTLRVGYLVK